MRIFNKMKKAMLVMMASLFCANVAFAEVKTGSYAVVADDIEGGITEVVRGCDLLGSVPRQIYLTRLLGGEEFEYMHVPMLLGPGGRKLSKRDLDLDMGVLRERICPERMLGELAFRIGLIDRSEDISACELVSVFDPQKLSKTDVELGSDFCGCLLD